MLAASPARARLSGSTTLLRCPDVRAGHDRRATTDARVHGRRPGFPVVEGVLVLVDERRSRASRSTRASAVLRRGVRRLRATTARELAASYLDRLRGSRSLVDGRARSSTSGSAAPGYTVIEAARAGIPAVGCDLSLAGLVNARRFAVAEGVAERTLWVCCSAERLPLASCAFACRACDRGDRARSGRRRRRSGEMARVLEPGGRAWVTVPHALRNISPVFRPANRRHDRPARPSAPLRGRGARGIRARGSGSRSRRSSSPGIP